MIKIFTSVSLSLLLFLIIFCDLENRYPEAGEFCTPMREIPECVQMDFRNKTLLLNHEKIELNMINRGQYERVLENKKIEIDLLSEHRIKTRILKHPELLLEKEEIYIRKKTPRVSIWTRIKNWKEKNN